METTNFKSSLKACVFFEEKTLRQERFRELKFFCLDRYYTKEKTGWGSMKPEEVKIVADTLKELNESYADLLHITKGTIEEVKSARQLYRDGNGSRLVKLGLAFVVFPEPTPVSETVGACLIAAGAVQKGIRSRAIYIEDVYKTFQNVLRDVWTTKHSLRV